MTTKDTRKKSPPTVGEKTVANPPRMITWHGMELVNMDDVPGLQAWMWGQTMPLVEDDPHPYSWVYYDDYRRFINGLPVID